MEFAPERALTHSAMGLSVFVDIRSIPELLEPSGTLN